MAGSSDVALSLDELKRIVGDDAVYSRLVEANDAKKTGSTKGRANHYGIASTMPPENPSRRVDIIDIEELTQKCEGGPCGLCRCYKSKKFPYCDGAHNKHNEETGDNAGPVVVNTLPPEKKGLEFTTDISDEELKKLVAGPRANNYGVASTMPPDNPSRSVHMVDIGDVRAAVAEKGVVALCRCFKSKKFPLCDGSHNAHNEATGDNAGPILLKATDAPPPPVTSHPIDQGPLKEIPLAEVARHNTKQDAWVVIHGKVYDITDFLPNHPGGVPILAQYLGKVADEGFDGVHTDRILADNLPHDKLLGKLPASDIAGAGKKKDVARPPIESVLSLWDMQSVAQHVMKKESWGYYITGEKDETTRNGNEEVFRRVRLAPRVMIDVSQVTSETKILGHKSAAPLYVSGAAKGGFAHESAEIGLAKACYAKGIIQMAPHMASKPLDEIAAARQGNQVQFLQLYMEKDRAASEATVKMATELGYKALFVTVDSAGIGKRETDLRLTPGGSAPRSKASQRRWADDLCWADIPKLRQWTNMPIILKGVQTGEDAVLAYKAGVEGIVVSNHGGRNCDTARPSLEALVEVMASLKAARYDPGKFEVFLDGGVRRGSDIFKALAVGASAVGIGRPALFGLAAYGQAGVEKTLEILTDELQSCMQFMGTPTLADIKPDHVKGLDKLDAWAWDTSREKLSKINLP